jgi:hypothetical protein
MVARNVKVSFTAMALLAGGLSVICLVSPSLGAQNSSTATQALQKAHVMERLAEAKPTTHTGTAPSFVLDPRMVKKLMRQGRRT